MNLEKNENETILSYINKYREIDDKIKKIEVVLEKMISEKNILINDLEYNRQEEIEFLDSLIVKYGEHDVMEYLKSLIEK
jgi:hypothetical protein